MFEPVPAPSSLGVPLLIGTCKDEMTLFSLDIQRDRFGADRLRSAAHSIFGDATDTAVGVYERTRRGSTTFDRYIAMTSRPVSCGLYPNWRNAERRRAPFRCTCTASISKAPSSRASSERPTPWRSPSSSTTST